MNFGAIAKAISGGMKQGAQSFGRAGSEIGQGFKAVGQGMAESGRKMSDEIYMAVYNRVLDRELKKIIPPEKLKGVPKEKWAEYREQVLQSLPNEYKNKINLEVENTVEKLFENSKIAGGVGAAGATGGGASYMMSE
jgi:hypothetical protein